MENCKNHSIQIEFNDSMPTKYKNKILMYLNQHLFPGKNNQWYAKNSTHQVEDLMAIIDELTEHDIVLKYVTKFNYNNLQNNTCENVMRSYANEIQHAKQRTFN